MPIKERKKRIAFWFNLDIVIETTNLRKWQMDDRLVIIKRKDSQWVHLMKLNHDVKINIEPGHFSKPLIILIIKILVEIM